MARVEKVSAERNRVPRSGCRLSITPQGRFGCLLVFPMHNDFILSQPSDSCFLNRFPQQDLLPPNNASAEYSFRHTKLVMRVLAASFNHSFQSS